MSSRPTEERRVVSVLFSDLAGFTEQTEQSYLEEVRERLTVYHRTAREMVEAHGGRVEKLMGDGVFAVFGFPTTHEDDPERAVRAGLALQTAIDSSLKIRNARRFHHGLANRCNPAWRRGAKRSSAACE